MFGRIMRRSDQSQPLASFRGQTKTFTAPRKSAAKSQNKDMASYSSAKRQRAAASIARLLS
jgi:hypothetical protein